MKKKSRSIRTQIMRGYSRIILVMFLLVVLLILALFQIRQDYLAVSRNQSNQASTQTALAKHYQWLEMLSESIQDGIPFQGSLDSYTCLLGKWISGLDKEDLADPTISKTLQSIQAPHNEMHKLASDLLASAQRSRASAYDRYLSELKPLTEQVISGLDTITSQYEKIALEESESLDMLILIMLIVCIVGSLAGFCTAESQDLAANGLALSQLLSGYRGSVDSAVAQNYSQMSGALYDELVRQVQAEEAARAAAQGDAVALGLYERAAHELSHQVLTLIGRHGGSWQGPIVASGGTWKG